MWGGGESPREPCRLSVSLPFPSKAPSVRGAPRPVGGHMRTTKWSPASQGFWRCSQEQPPRAKRGQPADQTVAQRAQVGWPEWGAHPTRPCPPRKVGHSPDGLDDFVSSIVVFVLKDKGTGFTPSGGAGHGTRQGLPAGPGSWPELDLQLSLPGGQWGRDLGTLPSPSCIPASADSSPTPPCAAAGLAVNY